MSISWRASWTWKSNVSCQIGFKVLCLTCNVQMLHIIIIPMFRYIHYERKYWNNIHDDTSVSNRSLWDKIIMPRSFSSIFFASSCEGPRTDDSCPGNRQEEGFQRAPLWSSISHESIPTSFPCERTLQTNLQLVEEQYPHVQHLA